MSPARLETETMADIVAGRAYGTQFGDRHVYKDRAPDQNCAAGYEAGSIG